MGYLPDKDKTIITQANSILFALNQAIKLLAAIKIIAYLRHSGGDEETKQINSSEKDSAPVLFTETIDNPV